MRLHTVSQSLNCTNLTNQKAHKTVTFWQVLEAAVEVGWEDDDDTQGAMKTTKGFWESKNPVQFDELLDEFW